MSVAQRCGKDHTSKFKALTLEVFAIIILTLALASIYKKTVDWSVGGSKSVSTLAIHHQSASLKWSDSKGSSA